MKKSIPMKLMHLTAKKTGLKQSKEICNLFPSVSRGCRASYRAECRKQNAGVLNPALPFSTRPNAVARPEIRMAFASKTLSASALCPLENHFALPAANEQYEVVELSWGKQLEGSYPGKRKRLKQGSKHMLASDCPPGISTAPAPSVELRRYQKAMRLASSSGSKESSVLSNQEKARFGCLSANKEGHRATRKN
ncbi:hypothetical protein GOBAR_AA35346 [Gossypium barbadense]|uniref:Uncharacterized protein n=1 Tax=Gossypium barbadense TaxID=3634 RepID=A0A2P5W2Q7_GOSBA|nr:hypothetical protein GOBAR_AA35346 [Gossypium barbadense]